MRGLHYPCIRDGERAKPRRSHREAWQWDYGRGAEEQCFEGKSPRRIQTRRRLQLRMDIILSYTNEC